MTKTNPNFLNGVPELLVLRLLSQKEMYGYELVREIRSSTREGISFGEGCIYPLLHSLEKDGILSSRRREVNSRERYYYRLSAKGAKRFENLSEEWLKVQRGVSTAMGVTYERATTAQRA